MLFLKKIFSSFKNKHFQSLIGTGTNAAIGMLIFSILYRALSKNDIGIYLVFMLILNLIDTLKSGMLTGAFVKFYSGVAEDRANEVAGSTWSLAAIITGVLILINVATYFCAGFVTDHAVILVFKYFAIVSLSTLPSFMGNLALQGERRFDRILWLNLTGQLLFLASIIMLMILKISTVSSIIFAYIVTNTITSVINLLLGWTKIRSIKFATKKTISEIFHFGKYSFGSSISSNLFRVTDTFFLSYFLGPVAIAVYNLGGKLNQIVEVPLLSLAMSGGPQMAGYFNTNKKDYMIQLMKKMIGMLTIPLVVLAILSVIFAEPVIAILGGNKYINSEAPNLFRIFMIIAIFAPTDRFFALALDVIHKPQINFYKILIMLTINLIADYAGVKLFKSVYSIAITNIFPMLAAIIISYVPLNKYFKFNFWSSYSLGYKELIVVLKQVFNGTFNKRKIANN